MLPLEQTYAVVGLGKSGLAATKALAQKGYKVWAIDADEAALSAVEALELSAVKTVQARVGDEQIAAVDASGAHTVVVAPVIPATGNFYAAAKAKGWQLIGEVELAWYFSSPDVPWVGVTGTNGKTTTTTLTSALLTAAGRRAPALGNVGNPIVTAVSAPAEQSPEVVVCELSSFQLHSAPSLAMHSAVCLNVAPDHLDWHGGLEAYTHDKSRIYEGLTGFALYPTSEEVVLKMVENAEVEPGVRAIGLTMGAPSVGQIGVVDDVIVDRAFHARRQSEGLEIATFADLRNLALTDQNGSVRVPRHILADVLAAIGLARSQGAEAADIRRGLQEFHTGAHRIVTVATDTNGVSWIDDSKATNAHAALASLQAQPDGSCIWIAGGLAKGAQFDDLVAKVKNKLAAAILIGVNQEPMLAALAAAAPEIPVYQMPAISDGHAVISQVVERAASLAPRSGSVLLAPACASMDQFVSYADRGEAFAAAVREHLAKNSESI